MEEHFERKMVTKNIITKIINDTIQKHNHISNDEIRTRMETMSTEEKKAELKGKLNPFEEKEYNSLCDDLEFWKLIEEDEKSENVDNPNTKKELERLTEEIFKYEKRIVRGYDLDKYKDNVPKYNEKDFKEEKPRKDGDDNIYELEQSQLDYQEEHMYIDGEHILGQSEVNGLTSYFGKKSTQINSELSSKYKDGLWENLPPTTQKEFHEENKKLIPSIDSAMDKSPGLKYNTVLYHGVKDSHIVNINSRVGEKVKLTSFISCSYDKNVGESYGEITNSGNLYVKFLVPEKTKGMCANDKHVSLTNYPSEHEYLLDRNQNGTIVDIDYTTGEVTILLE